MPALVLLSGLDSAAAMHWARTEFDSVEAISFWYGQPQGPAEMAASQTIASRRGVPWSGIHIGESVRGLQPIVPPEPGFAGGVSRANLPARNLILLTVAAAHAARRWPGARIAIVIGANINDARGFPDCRAVFLEAASTALSLALAGVADVAVRAPWVELGYRKADILAWAAKTPDALEDVRLAVSCYRGTRCGTCDACTLRASAFAECGLSDGIDSIRFTGGDPAREIAYQRGNVG